MKQNDWYSADDEIPPLDEKLCLLYVVLRNEFETVKYYDIGYIFADKWYDEAGHELIEVNGKTVVYWVEIPALPE